LFAIREKLYIRHGCRRDFSRGGPTMAKFYFTNSETKTKTCFY